MPESINFEDVRRWAGTFVHQYPEAESETARWRQPLTATAPVDDRFNGLKQVVEPDHLLPLDLLPTARNVMVFFIPFTRETAADNHRGDRPSLNWASAYEATNRLIEKLSRHLKCQLEKSGYRTASTPATHNFDEKRLISRWSHKHLGYFTGLGRFGVNAQLITPSGCAGRMGSLVTEAELGEYPLVAGTDKELCLHKNGEKCKICVKRCPMGAVSTAGINRGKCWRRLNDNHGLLSKQAALDANTNVCGKCQVIVPCSFRSPVAV